MCGRDRRGFVLAFLALGGCATLGAPAGPAAPFDELEPVSIARIGDEGLTIRVRSNGCTARPDFTFYVDRRGRTVGVAFARKAVDACKAAPGEAEITFTWAELGVSPRAPVLLLNPPAPPKG